jgi:hypothetical protein
MKTDLILAGFDKDELIALSGICYGDLDVPEPIAAKLHAKGWIDLAGGQMLLTLTGRTLLDQQSEILSPFRPA